MSWLNDAIVTTAEDKAAAERNQKRQTLKAERDAALRSMTYTLADGAVLQTRPQDLANFQQAIAAGVPRDWILADNSVRETTPEELAEALEAATAEAGRIWDDYAQALRGLS